MRNTRTILAVIAAVLLIAGAAFASAAWSKLFMDTYKPKTGGAIVKAKCQLCHTKGVALNPYGTSLKGKKIEAASLKAVEKLDSDKDKFTNIAEIKAGTLPGDPKSKPAAKPKK
jgi:mono/diheme cytochrome c family protein